MHNFRVTRNEFKISSFSDYTYNGLPNGFEITLKGFYDVLPTFLKKFAAQLSYPRKYLSVDKFEEAMRRVSGIRHLPGHCGAQRVLREERPGGGHHNEQHKPPEGGPDRGQVSGQPREEQGDFRYHFVRDQDVRGGDCGSRGTAEHIREGGQGVLGQEHAGAHFPRWRELL
ncbi:secreted insulinase-like peptidase [Cryptosporidium canis]|uniref:Secreted insulinase-like peptidase n=1 Tax=Cryptosporidium canis TaxID=195482 RepID=A0A9D5HXG4_9CRYT|nr:secreted insulinase-like peptidase [Cryptosporidium canis]